MVTVVQYPCSQFDYLVSGRTENEVQELFEAWLAAHHPAVIDSDTSIPRWETASYPPFNLQHDTVIIPPCCESFWNEDWEKQTADCTLIRNLVHRDEIVEKILAERNYSEAPFNDELIANCYALAAARFLFALISRNLYYIQTPDETRLKSLFSNALQASRNNQPDALQQALQSAFDEIVQAKDNYHPTQNYLIELTLATDKTLGKPLQQLLNEDRKINLFLSANVLATLPKNHPDSFALLKTKVEQGKVLFIVDDTASEPLSLLPILDAADAVLDGISVYRELLNVSPAVFGKFETGLAPILPQLLKLSELKGALHFAPLAGWRIKEDTQSKIVWQGIDHSTIDALVRYPIDASKYLGFFELAEQLGSQLGNDHVPTSVLVTFPGQQSVWLESLRRMAQFTQGLGKFVDIEEYFDDTTHSGGGMQCFGYETYPIAALTEVKDNPISQWNHRYQKSLQRQVQSSLEILLQLLNKPVGDKPLARQFVEVICPFITNDAAVGGTSQPSIIVNPLSFSRKTYFNDRLIDVPPLGYAYVEPSVQIPEPADKKNLLDKFFGKKGKPVLARKANDDLGRGQKRTVYLLENQYATVKFDAQSGVLRSVFTNRSRYNQLSRQIAVRKNQAYTAQIAESVEIVQASSEIGQIKITARLEFPDGEIAARLNETVTVRSESRLLEFDLTIEPLIEFDEDRWNSYAAVRYAWNDDTFTMRGCLNDTSQVLPDRQHLHSPKFVDLRHESASLTFFSEGLPFHRRSGDRQLDTLLFVNGETYRQFRLAIGVNMQNPMFVSQDFLLPSEDYVVPVSQPPKNVSSWLFQIESKNVLALYWEPIFETERIVGFIVYLQETEGRRAHFALRSFLPPVSASAMNFQGKEIKSYKVQDDAVLIDMHIHELLPLMVRI